MIETIKRIEAMVALMETQDNLATAHPVFCVMQKRRIYGIDDDYTETFAWIDGAGELAEIDEQTNLTEEEFENGWHRTGYIDVDEFVTPCFTMKAAQSFIEANAHNLNRPYVYVESAHRNTEWKLVEEALPKMLFELKVARRAIEIVAERTTDHNWGRIAGLVEDALSRAEKEMG